MRGGAHNRRSLITNLASADPQEREDAANALIAVRDPLRTDCTTKL